MRNRNKRERERKRGGDVFSDNNTFLFSFSVFTVIVEQCGDVSGAAAASETGSALTRATLGGAVSLNGDRERAAQFNFPSATCSTCGQCQFCTSAAEEGKPKIQLTDCPKNNWGISLLASWRWVARPSAWTRTSLHPMRFRGSGCCEIDI